MILASAGAITRANRRGVASGARISRGVCALSEIRRRARVAQAAGREGRAGGRGRASGVAAGAAVMVVLLGLLGAAGSLSRGSASRQPPVGLVDGGAWGCRGTGV